MDAFYIVAILGAILFISGTLVGYVFGELTGRTEAEASWREVQANLIRESSSVEGA